MKITKQEEKIIKVFSKPPEFIPELIEEKKVMVEKEEIYCDVCNKLIDNKYKCFRCGKDLSGGSKKTASFRWQMNWRLKSYYKKFS